jgi:TolB protein
MNRMEYRIAVLILAAAVAKTSVAATQIAFQRDDSVWIANVDGTGEKKIADGIYPAISPDAAQVVFITVEKSASTYEQHIAVYGIAEGTTAVFSEVPGDNSYHPVWAPDGKRILFLLRENDVWNLATIAADGTNFQILKRGAQNRAPFYSPCWAHDEKSIFCQDTVNIYRIGLDGTVLNTWRIETIVPGGGMSADGRIATSPDGKRLLLSVDMAGESTRSDWDGPPPALWTFEIASGKSARITPTGIFAWNGCWIDNENILFLRQPSGEKSASIYRISVEGKNLKRLIKNALFPTVS